MSTLSEDRLNWFNQSPETRKILDTESKLDAAALARERQKKLEREYQESLKIAPGRLVDEWREEYGVVRLQHKRTGRIMLDGEALVDGDHLVIYRGKNKRTLVTVRYNYVGPLHQIDAVLGVTDTGESFRLEQGQRAKRIEPKPAQPSPDVWRVRYRDQQWAVVRGETVTGSFDDPEVAGDLAALLNSFQRGQHQQQPTNEIHFKRM